MARFKGTSFAKSTGASIKPLPKLKPCIACNGSGHYDIKGSPKCSFCGGTGKELPSRKADKPILLFLVQQPFNKTNHG